LKVILAIPCYNCHKQISRTLNALDTNLIKKIHKIIIIDNKSKDNTLEEIKSSLKKSPFLSKVSIYQNEENYGLGGSFKSFIKEANENQATYLAFLHGDDQACAKDLSDMLDLPGIKDETLDAVLGARFMKESTLENYSIVREYGNKFLNIIFSAFLRKRIYEIGSGLNIYKLSSLPTREILTWPNHIAFDINLLFILIKKNILFYPIRWKEADQISNAKNIETGITVLWMLLKHLLKLNNTNKKWDINFKKNRIDI
jgi:glycosyltransferase involved in cell wall biosynthesis